jgi:hypothetical protein
MEQAPSQQLAIAPRVEGERALDEVVDGSERRGLAREGGDLPDAVRADLGRPADVPRKSTNR